MAYLVVNKDGTELIFNKKPVRDYREVKFDSDVEIIDSDGSKRIIDKNRFSYPSKEKEVWIGNPKANSLDDCDFIINQMPITIPIKLKKGTIKKILGKELTWNDNPVNY